MKLKKTLVGAALALGLTGGLIGGPVLTADLGIGDVQAAEAYTTSGCHYHWNAWYQKNERFCNINWNWWEEFYERRRDGWHVQVGSSWIRTVESHYHSGWV